MMYKCKICGGQTTIDSENGIAICDYCGTKQALPLFTDESERLLYESGNNYLLHSEYDKAENVFNQLLTIKPNAAELYWDLVLCKYGVTYVKDPQTGKYIPTCNRTHYTPIFSDANYQKAVGLSSGEKRVLFEDDARTIDNIQKGIIAVSKKEKPFDIFISYKETDTNGNRTKDSIEAQKLYEKLTEAGYKVFFSRITLEDKIGAEYEPYIYAALYSSRVMLTICSSKENVEAVWVKNEWSRFLGFRQNDNSKTLLPLYFEMDKTDLPDEFALLSSYDMSVDGFADELLRGIKKLIPLPIMKAKRRKQILKAIGITLGVVVIALGIAAAIIVPKELEKKRIQAEEALYEEAYQEAMALFDNADYTAAEEAFVELGDYKDSARMAARCPIQPDYDAAMQLYYDGKYAQAAWAFGALGDYEDAADQKKKAELSWRRSLATVVIDNQVQVLIQGGYYINTNGSVDSLPNKDGSSHKNTGINVVSISSGKQLFALHADGVLDNISQNGNVDKNQWQDIIQTTPFYEGTNVALRSDGMVIFGDLSRKECQEDQWLQDSEEWKNIVMLASDYFKTASGCYGAALAGLDVEGNVHLVHWNDEHVYAHLGEDYYTDVKTFMDYPDVFKDIKTIDLLVGDCNGSEVGYVNAVALRNDGKLVSYFDGEIFIEDAEDVVDVQFGHYGVIYTLCSDGKLYAKDITSNSNKFDDPILTDVIKVFNGYLITRSGTIHSLLELSDKFESLGVKSCIYDEWLARMR